MPERLTHSIEDVVANLKDGKYPNEQSVSQGIVIRFLHDLGWNIFSAQHVCPEYKVETRRVDFALLKPSGKPIVFIEVKQAGNTDGADRQLFEYAFIEGVPIAVLTDGKSWSFYLPAEQGSYEDRRVYKLDLLERSTDEIASKLVRYLDRERVLSNNAIEDARSDYRDRNRRNLALDNLPLAWRELLNGADAAIIDRVASEVETKCGVRPDDNDVLSFLRSTYSQDAPAVPENPTRRQSSPAETDKSQSGRTDFPARCCFILHGREQLCTTASNLLGEVLRQLSRQDRTFPQRLSRHPDMQGRLRTYVAQSPETLYPNRPDLRSQSIEFSSGWFVGTNINNNRKELILRTAAAVAGLTWDKDLKVQMP